MARRRNIEEEFRAIAPQGRRGILPATPIAVGVTGSGGADTSASMSQASLEIQHLEAQFRQQSALILANTQALQSNTTAHAPAGGVTGVLGGALGFLSPIASGLLSLFGGGGSSSSVAPLPYYVAPPSVQIGETLRAATPAATPSPATAPLAFASAQNTQAPNITVNVSAMDSQSFLDRSNDIASAVREAMLNLHPINDVVASL